MFTENWKREDELIFSFHVYIFVFLLFLLVGFESLSMGQVRVTEYVIYSKVLFNNSGDGRR